MGFRVSSSWWSQKGQVNTAEQKVNSDELVVGEAELVVGEASDDLVIAEAELASVTFLKVEMDRRIQLFIVTTSFHEFSLL